VIGYSSRQDGVILPTRDYLQFPYNESLTKQACLVKVAAYWPCHLVNNANIKVKCDHRSKFSNLSNWKEEA